MLTARALLFSCLSSSLLLGAACDSPDPAAPDVDLVTTSVAEPPGEHCATGGVVVSSGLDADDDGVLDHNEIESVEYVCAPEIRTLVREDKLAAGAACPSGGTSVHSGRDLDRDQILDDSEIEHTVNVCEVKELWSGDLATSAWSTPEAQAALSQIRVITGSLTVDTAAALPALELVGGNVSFTAAAPSLDLPALTRIVGGLTVSSNLVDDVSLPQLERVGSAVAVSNTAANALVSAPLLQHIAGDFVLGEGQQAAIDMDVLTAIGGNFALGGNPGSLHVPMLTTIGGDVNVFTSAVNTLALTALQTIGGEVDVYAPALTALQFPALTKITGKLDINAAALDTLGLGALTAVGGELHIVGTQLTQLQLPQLRDVGLARSSPGYSFEVHAASKLTTVSVPLLKHSAGMIQLSQCAALTAVQFPALMRAHGLVVHASPNVTEVSAPKLTNVNVLQVSELPKLATIAFGAVPRVDGTVYISGTALTDLGGLSGLTSTRFLTIEDNSALTDISALASLAYVALELEIEGNPQVPAADIQSLKARLGF